MTTMPWGKYRGTCLTAVPLGYLGWLLEECDLTTTFEAKVAAEVARRLRLNLDGTNAERPADRAACAGSDRERLRQAIDSWHRRETLRWHPDKGGDTRVAQIINAARDELVRVVDGG
jgi:hypothetical protein